MKTFTEANFTAIENFMYIFEHSLTLTIPVAARTATTTIRVMDTMAATLHKTASTSSLDDARQTAISRDKEREDTVRE